jgi:exodeoxyribonuclease VII large subunit
MPEPTEIFTLKQVAVSIQKTIADRYNRLYWVKAEMHKLNQTPKGHCYPELVHKEDGKIVAELRGMIWKTNYDKIIKRFYEVVKEPLQDGMTLLFQVKISYNPVYGMSLDIYDIDPTFSLGALQKEREETLHKLEKEGLLNANQKLPFPLVPKRVAIISVESSKGLSDFRSIISSNQWGYTWFFMLFSAQLNGDAAIEAIQKQLARIEKVKHHFDVVAIIRGGGGEIGLSCYNNYALAKAIAKFPLPILTGIGHSTNITVSELVAYKNAITPTELADYLVQKFHDFSVPTLDAQKTIRDKARLLLKENISQVENNVNQFKKAAIQTLRTNNYILKDFSRKLVQVSQLKFHQENQSLSKTKSNLISYSKTIRVEKMFYLSNLTKEFRKNTKNYLFMKQEHVLDFQNYVLNNSFQALVKQKEVINQLEKNIKLVDPIQVLKRGFSITTYNGKLVNTDNSPGVNEKVEIETYQNKIEATVIQNSTKNGERN